jgi:hypothetical protein
MSDLLTHPVLAVLRHNGTRYAHDDPERNTVDLTEREARPLKKLKIIGEPVTGTEADEQPDDDTGAAESGSEPAAGNGPSNDAPTGDARAEKIADAIGALDKEKDFTQSGTPKVKAVEAAVGFDVTAEEVAAVWDTLRVSG